MNSSMPAACASSTAYWISGLSTTGSISLGIALVAGRNRVPRPPTGKTALRTGRVMKCLFLTVVRTAPWPRRERGPGLYATAARGRASRATVTNGSCSGAAPYWPQQDFLGLVDLGGEVGRAALVRVVLAHQPPVRLLDLVGAWRRFEAEQLERLLPAHPVAAGGGRRPTAAAARPGAGAGSAPGRARASRIDAVEIGFEHARRLADPRPGIPPEARTVPRRLSALERPALRTRPAAPCRPWRPSRGRGVMRR